MNSIIGTWQVRMKTPIGTIDAKYHFTETSDGVTGTAFGAGEETPLREIVRDSLPDGEEVTWKQSITKPLRLNLEYRITVTGDSLMGHSRAGRLPRTQVAGERVQG
jgi:hypothetical protein